MLTVLIATVLLGAPQNKTPEPKWLTNFAEAQKAAKKAKKPMLVNFTGSDWCSWCHKLHDEVFAKSDFKKWADKKVILVEIDFPNQKKQSELIKQQNNDLQKKYKIQGFPTILLLDAEGKVLGQSGYMKGGPSVWTKDADKQLAEAAKKKAKPAPRPEPVIEYPEYVKKELYSEVDLRGKKMPEVKATEWLTAKPDLKGKVVLYDFWATWCGPCRKVIPEMNEWSKKFKDDLVIIGVSNEERGPVDAYLKEQPINYSLALDTKNKFNGDLKIQGIPHVYVVSPDGIVRWQGFPLQAEDTLTTEKLEQIIKASKKPR